MYMPLIICTHDYSYIVRLYLRHPSKGFELMKVFFQIQKHYLVTLGLSKFYNND